VLARGASLGCEELCSGVFPNELPTCAIDDDVNPNDRIERTEGSLLSPHTTGATLK
jgi:hypothetical protein